MILPVALGAYASIDGNSRAEGEAADASAKVSLIEEEVVQARNDQRFVDGAFMALRTPAQETRSTKRTSAPFRLGKRRLVLAEVRRVAKRQQAIIKVAEDAVEALPCLPHEKGFVAVLVGDDAITVRGSRCPIDNVVHSRPQELLRSSHLNH